jgi:hypothetical protein
MTRTSQIIRGPHGLTVKWDFDPILAIGGCKHGKVLPKSRSTSGDLMVMKPLDLSVFMVASPEPPAMLDDQTERYRTHQFMTPSHRSGLGAEMFPVYVEATMPLDEAQTWLQLLMTSIRLLATLAVMGLLDYMAALRKLERDVTSFEEWATLLRKLHQLRDELDGLG